MLLLFGDKDGRDLLKQIEGIISDLKDEQPDWSAQRTLAASWEANEAALRETHPELETEAVAALHWAFTYWYK